MAINRTILELKLKANMQILFASSGYQSNHFGIETTQNVRDVMNFLAINRTILELKLF